jgi:hypothetical protein
MKSRRFFKAAAVVGASALILGAFVAGPADAKKKKKKKPVAPVCAPITPYEDAADAKLTVVTDAATADAPIVLTVPTSEGLGTSNDQDPSPDPTDDPVSGGASHAWNNVQVDTAGTEAYLYARIEFPGHTDYDLMLRGPDGVATYFSAGGPPYQVFDGTGHGGHSEGDPTGASENIDGAPTADCAGYSVDVSGATTPGGDVTLKLWLGEAPAA